MIKDKLLITGGSGFIGGEIVKLLAATNAEILNVDCKPPVRPNQERFWLNCDVRDRQRIAATISTFKPNYVIHLASEIDVTLNQIEDFKTTIDGTRNIIDSLVCLSSLKRYIHISTQFVVTPGVRPNTETDFRPYTLYGEAKARSERLVRQSTLRDWVILRPTIIWGPWHPSFDAAIWKYIANGRYLHPVANQKILRCYGYVGNAAAQIVNFLTADLSRTVPRVFYIGDATIDHDLWADGFAVALTGKRARRVPKSGLWALGMIGTGLRKIGLRFPMDMGRYFRMTTPSDVDLRPTFEVAGSPTVGMAEGIKNTVEWLADFHPALFSPRR